MGMYGSAEVKVTGKTIKIEVKLENLGGLYADGDAVGWHFHAGYIGGVGGEGFSADDGNGAFTCGSTGGHYDPTLACGAATAAPKCDADEGITEDCCESKGYTDCAATDLASIPRNRHR